jgi:hypothetical protein
MELTQLYKSGTKRKGFTAHYNMGDEYIYIMGGGIGSEITVSTGCQMFNVNTLKWEDLPSMNQPRNSAGSFMSLDKRSLFVFGGA